LLYYVNFIDINFKLAKHFYIKHANVLNINTDFMTLDYCT